MNDFIDGIRKQSRTYSPSTGRIAESAGFRWTYLPGTNLKSSLTYCTNDVVTWSYEPHRDLLTAVTNATYSTYVYTNDLLGRRTSKNNEQYSYNIRDELIAADAVSYNYDDIGNRTTAEGKTYTANNLNQYTAIDDFTPQYDADGNQTLIKTSTGIWSVQYNAENRPIRWQSSDTVITMSFDRMGRRIEMRTQSADSDLLQRFVYDNYLCVQQLRTTSNALYHSYVWDPTEPIATRPLVFLPSSGTLSYYFHDGNKNVSDLVDAQGNIVHYAYTPFGTPTAISANNATENERAQETPFRFSSEYHDSLLGVTSYNYRCYLVSLGVWISRDPSGEDISKKLYEFVLNRPVDRHDSLGLELTLVYESAVGNPEVVASYSVLPKITSPLRWTKFHFYSSEFKSMASTAIPFPNGALQIERGYCECKCLPVDYSYSITPGKCVEYRQLMRQEYKDDICPTNTITSYTYKDLGWTYTPPQFNRHTETSKLYATTVKPVVSFEGDGTIKGVNCRLPCMQKCASLSDADLAPVNSQYHCGD